MEVGAYLASVGALCAQVEAEAVEAVLHMLHRAYLKGGRVFLFGNGGSGATASHFAEDLAKGTLLSPDGRKRLKAISLTDNTPYILALANDEGYETIFEEQMIGLAEPGDMAIGISGSGNSENVLRAIRYANENEMITVGFTGFDGGKLKRMASCGVHVACDDIGMAESLHMVVVHLIVSRLREMINERVVFLDRDGVINENRVDHVKSWEEFRFLPGALEGIRKLTEEGFRILVMTNQSAVGRGLLSKAALEEIHRKMMARVESAGGRISAIYYCPHRPDVGCGCRKPKPGLLRQAEEAFKIDLAGSYLVGDMRSDIHAGAAVGCVTILVGSAWRSDGPERGAEEPKWGDLSEDGRPDYVAADLREAVEFMIGFRF